MCYNKSYPACQKTQSKPAENDSCRMRQAALQQCPRGWGDWGGGSTTLHLPKFFSGNKRPKTWTSRRWTSKVKGFWSTKQMWNPQASLLTELFTSRTLPAHALGEESGSRRGAHSSAGPTSLQGTALLDTVQSMHLSLETEISMAEAALQLDGQVHLDHSRL